MYSMAHCVAICLFNIRNVELATYPAPEHGYGTIQVSSESVHDRERHLAMSLYKLKATVAN